MDNIAVAENDVNPVPGKNIFWRITRFFLFLVAILAIEWGIFITLTAKGVLSAPDRWNPDVLLLLTIIMEGPAVVFVTLFTMKKEGISLRRIGLAFHRQWLSELWWGFAAGAGLIALFFMLGIFFRIIDTAWNSLNFGAILVHGGELLLLFGLQCAIEELIFRGYPFQLCLSKINPAIGIASFSLLFGSLHAFNPDASWVGVANAVIAGILLSLAFYRTHALWMPIGIHWGWNFAQGFLFSFPVSGLSFPPDMLSTISKGPEWLSGGSFGPEGSFVAVIVLIAACAGILYSRKVHVEESMQYGLAFPEPENREQDGE